MFINGRIFIKPPTEFVQIGTDFVLEFQELRA